MAFTRDWDESTPNDLTVARQIDDYMRYLRVDLSDRLKSMFYGLTAGENTLAAHAKFLEFYDQPSVAQPSASYGRLYIKSGELFYQDASGNEKQITSAGVLNLVGASDITLDILEDTILNDTYLTGLDNAGTGSVDIVKVTTSDTLQLGAVTTLPDTSALATSGAPAADAQIANKKYVDDQVDTKDFDSSWTANDSESNALDIDESYTANGDGFFYIKANTTSTGYLYVDGVEFASWNGNASWKYVCIPVSSGETLSFSGGLPSVWMRWKGIGGAELVKQ
jgi:hypothetical protein